MARLPCVDAITNAGPAPTSRATLLHAASMATMESVRVPSWIRAGDSVREYRCTIEIPYRVEERRIDKEGSTPNMRPGSARAQWVSRSVTVDVAAPLRFIRHACPLPMPNALSVELSTRVVFIDPRAWDTGSLRLDLLACVAIAMSVWAVSLFSYTPRQSAFMRPSSFAIPMCAARRAEAPRSGGRVAKENQTTASDHASLWTVSARHKRKRSIATVTTANSHRYAKSSHKSHHDGAAAHKLSPYVVVS